MVSPTPKISWVRTSVIIPTLYAFTLTIYALLSTLFLEIMHLERQQIPKITSFKIIKAKISLKYRCV